MILSLRRWLAFGLLAAIPFVPAQAQLSIEIIGGAATAIPIAIVPFDAEATWPLGITGIVGADLARSGLFRLVNTDGVVPRPAHALDVQPAVWRGRGADAVVVGSMRPLPGGSVDVRFDLVDVVKQATLASMAYTVTPAQFRATAHKIADVIYEKMTGAPGVFSTRIAYVSFESRKPVVYVQSLVNGTRRAIANFRGSNSSPGWSPDGSRLVVTLSKDGGSQMFLMNPDGTGVTRVLTSASIDTEAMFTPDGQSLVFTSDRGGTPQIYRVSLATHQVERLTFEGDYNVSPRPFPDGKGIAFVHREDGRFEIATLDFATHQMQVLTSGPSDESTSIAPNGRVIIYANEAGGRGTLAAVSTDGRIKQRLVAPATDVREPA